MAIADLITDDARIRTQDEKLAVGECGRVPGGSSRATPPTWLCSTSTFSRSPYRDPHDAVDKVEGKAPREPCLR